MTRSTFPGRRRIEILARFHDLIVATGAVAMEGLLVGQGNQLSSDFQLDFRNFRQELRLGLSARMTIAASNYFGCGWVFFKLVRSKSTRPVRGPRGFQRGMLGSFGSRLGGMMTFNTCDLAALNTAILGDMVEVAELHHSQLCLRSQHAYIRGLAPVRWRSRRTECG